MCTAVSLSAIQVRIDCCEGELLAKLVVNNLKECVFDKRETQLLTTVQGIHDLYLIFEGEDYEIKSWWFEK